MPRGIVRGKQYSEKVRVSKKTITEKNCKICSEKFESKNKKQLYCPLPRKCTIEAEKRRKLRIKILVMSHYCKGDPICQCCGEKNIIFLTIDHIIPVSRGGDARPLTTLIYFLYIQKFPTGYQVLCYNCNMGKRVSEKCPHIERAAHA